MLPRDFVGCGAGVDLAVKVDIVALLDVGGVEVAAQDQGRAGDVVDFQLPRVLQG